MFDTVEVHQALYGYVDGHRLLASSMSLVPEAQRSLRSMTDSAFDGTADSYLTIYPLHAQGVQAFVRTWRTDAWTRPGSVWSHVLLIDLPDIGRMQGLGNLRDTFRQPLPQGYELPADELKTYEAPIQVRHDRHVKPGKVPTEALLRILRGLYESDQPVRLQVANISEYEDVLLAVYEQQWPKLRRNFSCRTRHRSSSVDMDLEVLERRSRFVEPEHKGDPPDWIDVSLVDLKHPDADYRAFLQLCGAESEAGRRDFRPLTRVYQATTSPHVPAQEVVELIQSDFRDPDEHRALKRSLFGKQLPPVKLRSWPTDELSRIRLAIASAPALDLGDLMLGNRRTRRCR